MSAAQILGSIVPLVLLLAGACCWLALWWERRHPSSYTRSPAYRRRLLAGPAEPSPEVWAGLSADRQEAYDTAVLDASEAAEDAARRAAERAVEGAVRTNSLYHP